VIKERGAFFLVMILPLCEVNVHIISNDFYFSIFKPIKGLLQHEVIHKKSREIFEFRKSAATANWPKSQFLVKY
jgi:hypothetical protein